jgi:hypothetical protein
MTSWRCEQRMIGECCQVFIFRHTTLLVISAWIGDNFIYLCGHVTSGLWRCWRILAALLLSGWGLGASTVYSGKVCSSGWCLGACRLFGSLPVPLSFMKRTNAKHFSGNSFIIPISTKLDFPVCVNMNVTVFRDVMSWGLVDGHQLIKVMCCFYIQGAANFVV